MPAACENRRKPTLFLLAVFPTPQLTLPARPFPSAPREGGRGTTLFHFTPHTAPPWASMSPHHLSFLPGVRPCAC